MRIGWPLALLLLIAGPARADWSPDAAVLEALARGSVHAEVNPDGGGVSGVVHGAVEIDASPETVWATILDCRRAGRMARSVKTCRLTGRDPRGRWDEREMTVRWNSLLGIRAGCSCIGRCAPAIRPGIMFGRPALHGEERTRH